MWTPEYFVRLIPLPERIDGVVSPNDDGSFDIYLNSRQPPARQQKWLEHELAHIRHDHFSREMDIASAEAEADGVRPFEPERTSFSSPEDFIAYCRAHPERVIKDYT
ncbi:MAG: ImmA/IrrE family metallo-endopeptidase [bacterium]